MRGPSRIKVINIADDVEFTNMIKNSRYLV